MANTPQSIKRARQAETRRRHNQGIGTKFRTMVKRVRANAGDADAAPGMFSEMQSAADIAARKGIIHPRKAARLKKRISMLIRNSAGKAADDKSADAAAKKSEQSAKADKTASDAEKSGDAKASDSKE